MRYSGKMIVLLAVSFVSAFLAAPALAAVVDGIAAIVNNEVISQRELNEAVETFGDSLPKNVKPEDRKNALEQARASLLNRMIDNIIITQEAKKTGIVVKDEEINGYVEDAHKRRNMTLDQLKAALEKEGSTYAKYRTEVKEYLMKTKLATREIRSKIAISEDEIGEYYSKHRAQYEGKESVKIKQILFRAPKTAGQDRLKMKGLAEAAQKKLASGVPFDRIMEDYAAVADTQAGTDLGFIEKGTMMSEVDEIVFRVKVDEVSPIIESPLGFHLITVIDRRGAGIKPLNVVREEIQEEIGREKMDKRVQGWIADLRKKSYIEIKVK